MLLHIDIKLHKIFEKLIISFFFPSEEFWNLTVRSLETSFRRFEKVLHQAYFKKPNWISLLFMF